MCGLVAIYSPDGDVNAERVSSAVAALRHRGPDGQTTWVSDDGTVGLGHARLAIIGINNGTQPIANEDGRIQIIVNGEFYDYERIRRELQAKGHTFRTDSDSEIALHLYEEYGTGCLEHLRGEFALVIWDERLNRLFAARDRFGIKPLVYAVKNGTVYVASEAKALFAAGLEATWDSESFFHAANMQYTLPDRTLFNGVNQLQPGHFMIAHDDELITQSYWDLDYPISRDELIVADEQEIIEQFRAAFSESVRLRLRSDTPICCHLSGGLDSSAVLGVAMQHATSPLTAFTVSFEEDSYDELEISQEMAKFAGAELHTVRVSQSDLVQYLPDAVYHSEGFAVNGHLAAKYMLNKEINRAGFKVALTGEGSDEIVAGYPHLRSDLFSATRREHLISELQSANRASAGIMLKHGAALPLDAVAHRLGYTPAFLEAKATLGFKINAVLTDGFKASYQGRDSYSELMDCFDVEGQMRGRDRVNQSLYLWSKTALANYILRTLGDGMEMSHSVEGRLPFLDHHLFEFVRRLPVSIKIKDVVEKYILREATKPVITETIYKRRKHPFVAPPLSAFCSPAAGDLLNDMLRGKSFQSVPFFDQRKVVGLLDELPKMDSDMRAAYDSVLMTAMSAAALQEKFHMSRAV
jgi:asparagine synthase (glutamine-hydrolysing)